MLSRICRFVTFRFRTLSAALMLLSAISLACAQDVAVTRLPIDTDMTVRLINLTSHVSYDRSGDSYFIVPAGRYSIQLLRDGATAYQEVEYIDNDSPATRTINPNRREVVMGLSGGNPAFDPNLCAALEIAAQLAIRGYGLHDTAVQRRLTNAEIAPNGRCATSAEIDDMGQTVSGSYGLTHIGLVTLSIEFTPLAPQGRPRNQGNSPIYRDPSTQRLATAQQPRTNLAPNLVADLKDGLSDVAFDDAGKPLLVCAAIDANTPLFCDSNGFAVATPAIANLRGIYRFHAKSTPVDHWGVELDHWTDFVREDELDDTEKSLTAAAAALRRSLEQGIAKLQAESVPAVDTQKAGQRAVSYSTPDLISLISSTQAAIDLALRDPSLRALRQHFPANLTHVGDLSIALTPDAEAERIFRELRNDVSVLESVSDNLAIDLVFKTAPVETEGSHLNFVNCPRCSTIVSQGGQHRFYRGRYYIQATLDGYVAYEGWLDLVEDPRHILGCDMVRVRRAVNRRTSACSLRIQ